MNYDEKTVVKVGADGKVASCAKGLSLSECGYEPGAKVCGKCGAMPVQIKGMGYGEMTMPVSAMPKKKPSRLMPDEPDTDPEAIKEDDAETPKEKLDPEDIAEGDDLDTDPMANAEDDAEPAEMPNEKPDAEDLAEPDDDAAGAADMAAMRKRRLASLGMDVAAVGKSAYMCALDRKVYPGGATVCDDCVGGCVAEKGMPGLLHVEGIAEDMFDGKVIDSGYSSEADMFVIDVQVKDGRAVEMFVDGTTAEVLGWHKLDSDAFEQKSAFDDMLVISMSDAADIAVKSIEGDVVSVEPDVFEGFDSYAVEIDGLNGKSYDVFVSLDGEVMGYDVYEPEEAEDIEAEAAEIALKRAFSPEQRTKLAESGEAMDDGSFPIVSKSDLENAISAYGRASDKPKAKLHIMKRAKALGLEKIIPASWMAGGDNAEEKTLNSDSDNFISSLLEFEILAAEIEQQTN